MRADIALAVSLALGACRTGSPGPDVPLPDAPGPAISQTAEPRPLPANAPTYTPNEVERAAVDAACSKQIKGSNVRTSCEGTHYLGDFIIVKARWKMAERDGDVWYLLMRVKGEYLLYEDYYIPPGGESEPVATPQAICDTDLSTDGLPLAGTGIVRAEMRDLSLDGRDDLLVECRSESFSADQRTEEHYLQICLAGPSCGSPVRLRRVVDGRVEIDVDVKFFDGWIRRTERVYNEQGTRGDIRLSTPQQEPPTR